MVAFATPNREEIAESGRAAFATPNRASLTSVKARNRVAVHAVQYRAAGRSVFLGLLEVLEKAENPNLSSGFECCTSGT